MGCRDVAYKDAAPLSAEGRSNMSDKSLVSLQPSINSDPDLSSEMYFAQMTFRIRGKCLREVNFTNIAVAQM